MIMRLTCPLHKQNNAALRQLPFLGKKTVPAALRKDLWQPFATISFPSPFQGLKALHKLREYRKLHELSYPLELIQDKGGRLLGKKARGKVLMNQKANSVADIAAVLKGQEGDLEKALKEKESLGVVGVKRPMPKRGILRKAQKLEAKIAELEKVETEHVKIQWANILDAEFAESWPDSVVHDGLAVSRHTAPHPEQTDIPKPRADIVL
jgi:Transcriptional regulation of mitochondrial recombination